MNEESASGQVEKIMLVVEAPIGDLASSNSGLNYAIGQMDILNTRLDTALRKYRELTSVSGGRVEMSLPQQPHGTQPTSSTGSGQLRLSDYADTQKGKVQLSVPAEQISAFVVGQVKLMVNAENIEAQLAGGGTARVTEGAAPAGAINVNPIVESEEIGKNPTEGPFTHTKIVTDREGKLLAAEYTRALDELGVETVTEITNKAHKVTKTIQRTADAKGVVADVRNEIAMSHAGYSADLAKKIGQDPIQNLLETAAANDKLAQTIRGLVQARQDDFEKTGKQLEMNQLLTVAAQQEKMGAEKLARAGRMQDAKNSAVEQAEFAKLVQKKKEFDKYIEDSRKAHELSEDQDPRMRQALRSPAEQSKRDREARQYLKERQEQREKERLEQQREGIRESARMYKTVQSANLANNIAFNGKVTPQQRDIDEARANAAFHARVGRNEIRLGKSAIAGGDTGLGNELIASGTNHMLSYVRATNQAAEASARLAGSNRLIGKNMLDNIKHVTTWAASVGVLYGTLSLVKRSLEENMEIGREQAILSQIYHGNAAAVSDLTEKVLSLAAANGQAAAHSMKSATEFARLFHTQTEILEATNAALIGVNVSGMEVGQMTEFLSMMTQVYSLRASELGVVIGQLAYLSQNYNVTNQDLIRGMEASAEAAKEAGLSYTQTFGIIAGGVSATKQSGTAIGNTLKTLTTQMSNPEVQNKLRLGSDIEVTNAGGLKEMPDILKEIYLGFERMNSSERQSLLFNVGGRQNATRLAGILDKFIEGQVKAINSQLNLNSAEKENVAIMDTLKGQLGALIAEWDRFILLQGKIPMQGLKDISSALKNVLAIANAPGIRTLVTTMGALGVAMSARMLVSGFQMDWAKVGGGAKGGLVTSTIQALKGDVTALGAAFNTAATSGITRYNQVASVIPGMAMKSAAGISTMSKAARFAAVSFVALTDVVLPLLAIWGLISGFNALMDHASGESASKHGIEAYEHSKSAMEAHKARKDLMEIGVDALSDERTPLDRKKTIARDLAGAQLPEGTSAEIAALAKENQLLVEQGNIRQLLINLQKSQADAEKQAAMAKIATKAQLETNIDEYQQKISLLEEGKKNDTEVGGSVSNLFTVFPKNFGEGFDEAIDRWKTKLQEAKLALVDLAKEAATAFNDDAFQSKIIRSKSIGANQSAAFSGLSEQYNQLDASSPLDLFYRKRAELEEKQAYLERQRAALKKPGSLEGLHLTEQQKMDVLNTASDHLTSTTAELNQMNRPDIIAQQANATRLQVTSRMAKSEYGEFATGDGAGEQMVSQYKAAQDRVKGKMVNGKYVGGLEADAQNPNLSQDQRNTAQVTALALRVEMTGTLMKAQEKLNDLQKEETNLLIAKRREYEKALLTAGPGELLRKLAVNQLNKNGTNAGKFFAMDQGGRSDFLALPENSEEIRSVRRDRRALMGYFGRENSDVLGNHAVDGANARRDLYRINTPQVDPQANIDDNILKAATALKGMTEAITGSGGVIYALNQLSDRVNLMFSGSRVNSVYQASSPVTAQRNTR